MRQAARLGRLAPVLYLIAIFAGCMEPKGGLEQLPEPPVRTRIWERPAPVQPPPKPVAPPPTPAMRGLRGTTLVVDAGHGGRDPGARGLSGAPERTINLSIAMELARQLNRRGANVVLTRDSNEFIELEDRAEIADRYRADLFVSIHCDSHRDPSMAGATLYIGRGASSTSVRAAECIAAALEAAGISCRGVRDAGFKVLVGHSRPAVLIECGYLTNRTEANRLNDPAYQARIAAAIAAGIAAHFSKS